MQPILQHPQEIPLVFRSGSGQWLPSPAFSKLTLEASNLGPTYVDALFLQVDRQIARRI